MSVGDYATLEYNKEKFRYEIVYKNRVLFWANDCLPITTLNYAIMDFLRNMKTHVYEEPAPTPPISIEWVEGRAFVYAEEGEVEYFLRFESSDFLKGMCIRSFCGGLRQISKCRPLPYVCNPKYLKKNGGAK
jgi:hypothetical protein